jgi:hypothetical protein
MESVATMTFEGNTKSFMSMKCNEFLRTFSQGSSDSKDVRLFLLSGN